MINCKTNDPTHSESPTQNYPTKGQIEDKPISAQFCVNIAKIPFSVLSLGLLNDELKFLKNPTLLFKILVDS